MSFLQVFQKVTKNHCQRRHYLLVRLSERFDETKRTSHHPWCGDDAYVLGRGVIKPQAMVGAKAALGNGDTGVPQ